MTRILTPLALLSLLMLIGTLALGLSLGDFPDSYDQYHSTITDLAELDDRPYLSSEDKKRRQNLATDLVELKSIQERATFHRLLGIGSGLMVMLVNSISLTYFIGTSRWCKEVVLAYKLPVELVQQSRVLKRQTFSWALASMLVVVLISALGAASDPIATVSEPGRWNTHHLIAASAGTLFLIYSFYLQWNNVARNHVVIQQVLDLVEQTHPDRIGD